MNMITIDRNGSAQLPALHLLRFFLSVSILIVHFPHFFYPYSQSAVPPKSSLPFATILEPIYSHGGFAVEIFWMISGVIFCIYYLNQISDRQISFPTFIWYRFSRLYPLHLATLISVAVLQWMYINSFGTSFIYQNYDIQHFVLNLLTINFWNAKFGLSFNGPFWSVSVEIFTYLVFFFFAYCGMLKSTKNVAKTTLVFFGFYALGILSPFYECLLYFFAGVLLTQKFRWFTNSKLLFLSILVIAEIVVRSNIPTLQQHFEIKRIVETMIMLPFSVLIVISFTKFLSNMPNWAESMMMKLGNLTYSVYMIHISVQIFIVLFAYDMGTEFFNTKTFFGCYIFVTLILGGIIYRYFEVPAQTYLRSFINDHPKKRLA